MKKDDIVLIKISNKRNLLGSYVKKSNNANDWHTVNIIKGNKNYGRGINYDFHSKVLSHVPTKKVKKAKNKK